MEKSMMRKFTIFICMVALYIPSCQLMASDNLKEAVKIVALSAAVGGLFCVVDQAYYHNRFCSLCASSYMDYEKFFVKGMTEGLKIGAFLAAAARIGSRSQIGWQDCIMPLGVSASVLLCADVLAQEAGYRKAYHNPEFANQMIDTYPHKLLAKRDSQNDANERFKQLSGQLAAVDYSYWLLSKSRFVVNGGLMLYIALQRYQQS